MRTLTRWATTLLAIVLGAVGVPAVGAASVEGQIANGERGGGASTIVQVLDLRRNALCSGTFVDEEWVLTAAHCVGELGGPATPPSDLVVYVDLDRDGRLPRSPGPADVVAGVRTSVVHPTRDVALVRVDAPLPVGVDLLPLATPGSEPPLRSAAVPLVGYGWGDDRPNDLDNTELLFGGFASFDVAVCDDVAPVDDNELCYTDPALGLVDVGLYEPCAGDSGGPLFADVDGTVALVGIITASAKPVGATACSGTFAIGLGERVAPLADWIASYVSTLDLVGPEPAPAPPIGDGYWMLDGDGRLYAYGDAQAIVPTGAQAPVTSVATKVLADPLDRGVWVLEENGTLHPLGGAPFHGDVVTSALLPGERTTTLAALPDGTGYWIFTDRGRAFAYGAAPFLGDASALALNGPIVDAVALPDGSGYYLVGADGGIFAYGGARFFGSMGDTPLNQPVNGLVPDPDGEGYWLVASDGGVFAFEADFQGSMGGTPLNQPINGMVAFGDGYLMVAGDGGVFNFSTAPFLGSLGGQTIPAPIVAIAPMA